MNQQQLNNAVSLSLTALNLGLNGNKENFVQDFCHNVVNDRPLAEGLFNHLEAIETGMHLNKFNNSTLQWSYFF